MTKLKIVKLKGNLALIKGLDLESATFLAVLRWEQASTHAITIARLNRHRVTDSAINKAVNDAVKTDNHDDNITANSITNFQ